LHCLNVYNLEGSKQTSEDPIAKIKIYDKQKSDKCPELKDSPKTISKDQFTKKIDEALREKNNSQIIITE
jgi:hypothetical protein